MKSMASSGRLSLGNLSKATGISADDAVVPDPERRSDPGFPCPRPEHTADGRQPPQTETARRQRPERRRKVSRLRTALGSVESQGHLAHQTSGGIVTPQPGADLKVHRGGTVRALHYGKEVELTGFGGVLNAAGHVFGSSMMRVGDMLFTGELNPEE